MLDFRLASLLSTLACVCATSAVSAASITQDVIIDSAFPEGEPLEKAIDYFDGGSIPSVIVGNGRGGMYLYRSSTGTLEGPWKRSIVNPNGSAYERARPLRFKGETYPGLIASLSNQIAWLQNPKNRAEGDIADPWPRQCRQQLRRRPLLIRAGLDHQRTERARHRWAGHSLVRAARRSNIPLDPARHRPRLP